MLLLVRIHTWLSTAVSNLEQHYGQLSCHTCVPVILLLM
jgi:hypothetical protein